MNPKSSHGLSVPGDTLVIHCSDPRFQSAFQQRQHELGLFAPTKLVLPGGIYDLLSPARVKGGRQLWLQIEFLVKHLKLKRLLVFRHDDCLWRLFWGALLPDRWEEATALKNFRTRSARLGLSVVYERAEINGGAIRFITE